MRTRSSPEDDPGVMEDETVGALAGRSGVVMAKTRPIERKKIYTAQRGWKADSCKTDSCKCRLGSMNYACAIKHAQLERPEIIESRHTPLPEDGINSIQLR